VHADLGGVRDNRVEIGIVDDDHCGFAAKL
jgi:hypothetical protein